MEAYRRQLTQFRLETIKNLLEVLMVVLLLRNQFKLLFLTGFNPQLQTFQTVFDAGQSRLNALRPAELHDGVNALGAKRNTSPLCHSGERGIK